ncbi:MAG: hypothetical protein NTU88_05200 [Armatimonadetes bacterium]|nr:hypothetical protein [Armatimonadota bacterium]
MEKWITPGRYVSGREMAAANLAEMIDLRKIKNAHSNGSAANGQALENGALGKHAKGTPAKDHGSAVNGKASNGENGTHEEPRRRKRVSN